jgi:hypothetical protein
MMTDTNNATEQREIYPSNARETLLKVQQWLNTQPLEHLGGMLVQAGNWRRHGKTPRDRVAGRIFYDQVLEAMRPEYDILRQSKPSGIPS